MWKASGKTSNLIQHKHRNINKRVQQKIDWDQRADFCTGKTMYLLLDSIQFDFIFLYFDSTF